MTESTLPHLPEADQPPKLRRLDLPERLDLAAADELAEALEHLCDSPLEIDASAVTQLGTLCAQVLLAARLQWQSDRVAFRLVSPSAAFRDGLTTLGLPSDIFENGSTP